MSLILDALRKAERERNLGQAPTMADVASAPTGAATRRAAPRRWVIAAAGAVVLVGLFAFLVARARHGAVPAVAATTPSAVVVAAASPQSAPEPSHAAPVAAAPEDDGAAETMDDMVDDSDSADDDTAAADDDADANTEDDADMGDDDDGSGDQPPPRQVTPNRPQPAPAPRTVTPRTALGAQAAAQAAARPVTPPPAAATRKSSDEFYDDSANADGDVVPQDEGPVTRPASPAAATAGAKPAKPASSTPAVAEADTSGVKKLRDMPVTFRSSFPDIKLEVHVYDADPAKRWVMIGGRKYGEGTALDGGGPQIDEITAEGIVFAFRGEKVLYTLGR